MDQQYRYEVIKNLVDSNGNKDTAALRLGVTRRHINRLIIKYKAEGKAAFIHGNTGKKPITSISDETRKGKGSLG